MVDYWAALPLGASIGIAFLALAYMASQLLSSEPMRAYVKIELGELILSFILCLVVLAAFDQGPGMLSKALNIQTPQFGVAEAGQALHASFELPLQQALDALAKNTFRMTKIISYNYNGQLAIPYFAPMFSSSPGAGASPLMLQLQTGMDSTSMNLLLVRGVRVGAVFLDYAVQLFLLPLALLLRFIPPTRKVGGLLLGISLAIHLVYPGAVGMGLEMGGQFFPQGGVPVIADPGTAPGRAVICSPVMQGIMTAGEVVAPQLIAYFSCAPLLSLAWLDGGASYFICVGKSATPAPIDPSAFGVAGIVSDLWWLAQFVFQSLSSVVLMNASLNMDPATISAQAYHPLVDQVMPAAVNLNLAVLIIMVFILAATIVLARNFAQVLGGEGQFYGLVKLV